VIELVKSTSPECIYNFAGQTYVAKSWEMLDETMKSSGLIPSYFLDAIVKNDLNTKFFQASSSEIYFPEDGEILTEESPLSPRNPYGCSKSFAHNMVKSYRNRYGMFAVNGILFNHESPRRDANFLSKKIIQSAIKIKLGLESSLTVGNINVSRDWGYAPDYVEGIFRMMQMKEPEDIIFSTGIACTVDSMIKETFKILDLDYEKHVKVDEKLFRPFEAKRICGSNKKASALIGWAPTTDFKTMIMIMIDHELNMTSQSKKNE
jgi:GDPmannose 4,6-dehydratase